MMVSIPSESMDGIMVEDVFKLAEALDVGFFWTCRLTLPLLAIADLTSDGEAISRLHFSDLFPPQDLNIRSLHLLFLLTNY